MSEPARLEEVVRVDPARSERATVPVRAFGTGRWSGVAVVALALLLWAPRLLGPIDLRWDAGVYYLLGTSLAAGEGYRIPSEPGSPEAVQYPPLLPMLVAAHQWVLGTADPEIVAPWLRCTYAVLFVAYALAVFALARVHLRPGLALAATALCLLHAFTFFLSDVLYTELPFALISVAFALAAGSPSMTRPRLREMAAFALVTAGFLLRTAGVALLAAWVFEAFAQRRWRLALARGALALVPVALWQAHVMRVRASDDYARPAYEYQRATYQYYNVTYAENILLIDPFRPERGRADASALAARLATNLASMPAALGEAVSAPLDSWQRTIRRAQHHLLGRNLIPIGTVWVPILGLGALVVAGLVVLVRRGAWSMAAIALVSIALVCVTPWPAQFARYLSPVAPFLTIAAVLALARLDAALLAREHGRAAAVGRTALASVLVLTLAVQAFTAVDLFLRRERDGATFVAGRGAAGPRFFYHDRAWLAWEEAVAWIEAHAPPDAIVATSSPHLCYLRTGRPAVLPPMEADPAHARRLLEAVPVSYVIVDELSYPIDSSRRYALPAVESGPASWRVVHTVNGTRIFARAPSAESSESATNLFPD